MLGVQSKILWHECYLQGDEFVFVYGKVRGVDFETIETQFEVFVNALKKRTVVFGRGYFEVNRLVPSKLLFL